MFPRWLRYYFWFFIYTLMFEENSLNQIWLGMQSTQMNSEVASETETKWPTYIHTYLGGKFSNFFSLFFGEGSSPKLGW